MNILIERIRLDFYIRRVSHLAAREICKRSSKILLLVCITLLVLMNQKPVSVKAQTPIDLELGGDGAISWDIDNISPGDSGVKVVTLHNAGDKDGAVTIWLSEIAEEDYGGDGAVLDDCLLFGIVSDKLDTNIAMPNVIHSYPQNFAAANFIHIDRLQAGETVTLTWEWEFPLIGENHNLAQGDGLSFTINYHLREIVDTGNPGGVPGTSVFYDDNPVTGDEKEEENNTLEVILLDEQLTVEISEDGISKDSIILADIDGMFTLEIPGGTRITGNGGISLSRIELTVVGISVLLPDNTIRLTPIYQLIGYDTEGNTVQIQYNPAVKLTMRYDPGNVPPNSFQPYIGRYSDEEGLVPLQSSVNFPVSLGRVDCLVTIGDLFMALVEVAPPPPPLPVYFTASNLIISPHEPFEGDPVKISVTITNEGSEDGTHELYLIVDGIVRAIQEVTLGGKSSETLTFEITNLAAGFHQIKAAGLTETVRIVQVVNEPLGSGVDWMALDLSVAGVITVGLLLWFLYMQRARRRATEIGI